MLVWQTRDGEYVVDDDGNFMHVFVSNQDPRLMEAAKKALASAAKTYGEGDGHPVFWAGRRPIDNEELERQLQRAQMGLVPDPLDIAAIKEEERLMRQQNAGS